jgi:molybdopterin-binding protein
MRASIAGDPSAVSIFPVQLFGPAEARKVLQDYSMNVQRNLLTPREAARMLGISYPTIKKWILDEKLRTIRTPGGHHRIALASLKPFLEKDGMKPSTESRERYRRVSGRNQLPGKVISVRCVGLMAEVVLAVGDATVTAIITAEAANELALKKGDTVAALIKSTDVMIERLDNRE